MHKNTTLDIAFCCNDNYLLPATIMLESLLESNKKNTIIAHTFNNNLSNKSLDILENLIKRYDGKLITYTLPKDIELELTNLPLPFNYISAESYYRLFIPFMVSSHINKLLYLDCDILVRGDISDLFIFDDNFYIAGSLDISNEILGKNIGVDTYINAGVILFNQKELIKDFTTEKVMDACRNVLKMKSFYADQDVVNILFQDNIKVISDIYDFQKCFSKKYVLTHRNEVKDAKIVHFISDNKPWKKDYVFPYTLEYYRYLKKQIEYSKKIQYWLYKPLGIIKLIKRHIEWKKSLNSDKR